MALLDLCTEEDLELAAELEREAHNRVHTACEPRIRSQTFLIEIHAGSGGREAQDFARMLLRMYTRYAVRRMLRHELIDEQWTREGGLRNATLRIEHAPQGLRHEEGIHRLARVSPFGSGAHKRQTSFCSVQCLKAGNEARPMTLVPETEIRYETFRSSGPGGQHANVTASAVRATHLRTGIRARCQSERSQHRNRALARELLSAKVRAAHEDELRREKAIEHQARPSAAFGSQIRSYLGDEGVVREHRTGRTVPRLAKILNGELEQLWPDRPARHRVTAGKHRTHDSPAKATA